MRSLLIAGNWKLFYTKSETLTVLNELRKHYVPAAGVEVLVCPTFVNLDAASTCLKGSKIFLGAQDVFSQDSGAFTGEISAPMLKDVGCDYVIIGHSERRQLFGETSEQTQQKVSASQKNGLIPILCVGETLDQRTAQQTFEVIQRQLILGLKGIDPTQPLVIAYEPVWAIGTGRVATPQQAQDVHKDIRSTLKKMGFPAEMIQILYGGSVKPDNVAELVGQEDIDGALVGGASLKPESFLEIINHATKEKTHA
jgi:triosephosphate isomerase